MTSRARHSTTGDVYAMTSSARHSTLKGYYAAIHFEGNALAHAWNRTSDLSSPRIVTITTVCNRS